MMTKIEVAKRTGVIGSIIVEMSIPKRLKTPNIIAPTSILYFFMID